MTKWFGKGYSFGSVRVSFVNFINLCVCFFPPLVLRWDVRFDCISF